jgi:hypothetical protein
MQKFWNWILQNLSHIFNVFGIILTLYFGVWYVPSWLVEYQREKIINAHKNVEQSIKELVFSDSICTYNEIAILLKAKEIEIGENFNIDPNNVLVMVQESFMQDKFLPLVIRKQLMNEIEIIKNQIPKQSRTEIKENSSKEKFISLIKNNSLSLISVIATILAVAIGIISFYQRFKNEKEKEEEIANQINKSEILSCRIESAILYEKRVLDVIKNFPNVKIIESENYNSNFDLIFEYNNNQYFVEAKYLLKSKVGLDSIERIINQMKGLEGTFILIHNSELTTMAKNRFIEIKETVFNHSNRKIILLKVFNENELKIELDRILK